MTKMSDLWPIKVRKTYHGNWPFRSAGVSSGSRGPGPRRPPTWLGQRHSPRRKQLRAFSGANVRNKHPKYRIMLYKYLGILHKSQRPIEMWNLTAVYKASYWVRFRKWYQTECKLSGTAFKSKGQGQCNLLLRKLIIGPCLLLCPSLRNVFEI